MTAGSDFVANLHAKGAFDWRDVSDVEATRGLKEGDYYLAVYIPSDFSANLVSGQGDDPQRAKIMLRRNDANGFVIGSITPAGSAERREGCLGPPGHHRRPGGGAFLLGQQ